MVSYLTIATCYPAAVNYYHQVSNIRRTLVGNQIVDHSDVVGASPVGAAPTTSSFSTQHLASIYCAKTTASRDEKHLSLEIWCVLYKIFYGTCLWRLPITPRWLIQAQQIIISAQRERVIFSYSTTRLSYSEGINTNGYLPINDMRTTLYYKCNIALNGAIR